MRKNVLNQIHPLPHAQNLIWAFALHWYILELPMNLLAVIEGSDQTARMRMLIWSFAVRICPKTHFRMMRPSLLPYVQDAHKIINKNKYILNCRLRFIDFQWAMFLKRTETQIVTQQ